MANPNPVHKFEKGNSFGGRPAKIQEIRSFCQEQGPDILAELIRLLKAENTQAKVKFDIAKLLLAYAYGNPSDSLLDIKEHNDKIAQDQIFDLGPEKSFL